MKHSLGFLLVVSSIAAFNLHAAPVVTLQKGPVMLFGQQACLGWVDDSVTMVVKESGKILTRYHFCSVNGGAAARLVTDAIKNNYIFLDYATGHGTNAAQEYLKIFHLPQKKVDSEFYEYLRTPISGGAGLTSQWVYHYRIEKPKCGGLRLVFTRAIENGTIEHVFTMPAEKARVIEVGVPYACLH